MGVRGQQSLLSSTHKARVNRLTVLFFVRLFQVLNNLPEGPYSKQQLGVEFGSGALRYTYTFTSTSTSTSRSTSTHSTYTRTSTATYAHTYTRDRRHRVRVPALQLSGRNSGLIPALCRWPALARVRQWRSWSTETSSHGSSVVLHVGTRQPQRLQQRPYIHVSICTHACTRVYIFSYRANKYGGHTTDPTRIT